MRHYQSMRPYISSILNLHDAGYTHRQVADALGLTRDQVKQTLARWRRRQRAGFVPLGRPRSQRPPLVSTSGRTVVVTEKKIPPLM